MGRMSERGGIAGPDPVKQVKIKALDRMERIYPGSERISRGGHPKLDH
jgi:hypothetical protein